MNYMPKPKEMLNKRALGGYYEQMAANYLLSRDYKILARNFRCRLGEIDIIAQKQAYIIFIEVKYRRTTVYGYPREAVTYAKQRHIYRAAQYYLLITFGYEKNCRFDVIEILEGQLNHIKAAF